MGFAPPIERHVGAPFVGFGPGMGTKKRLVKAGNGALKND